MNSEWQARYAAAQEAARLAGQLALKYFDANVAVEWKSDHTPVTVADRESEKLLRDHILSRFPKDGFLGEEFGDQPGTSGYRWIIDPIDGTRSYVRGVPIWATLVALEFEDKPIVGVAEVPALSLTYRAMQGDGAFRGDRRLRVSNVASMAEAHLYYSSLSWFIKAGCQDNFLELAGRTQRQRGFGDFYGFLLVAQGSGEIMVEHGVHVWDVAPIRVIIEEAGGRFTDWDGNPTIYRTDVIATNGKLHEEALKVLRGK